MVKEKGATDILESSVKISFQEREKLLFLLEAPLFSYCLYVVFPLDFFIFI